MGYGQESFFATPATINVTGVTVDTTTHIITITNTNGLTLDGYDFSGDGGYGISIIGSANVSIKNSRFAVGANLNAPIVADSASDNLYVGYNVFDGGGSVTAPGALVTQAGTNAVFEFNLFENAGGDAIDLSGGGTISVRNNLFEQAGW